MCGLVKMAVLTRSPGGFLETFGKGVPLWKLPVRMRIEGVGFWERCAQGETVKAKSDLGTAAR